MGILLIRLHITEHYRFANCSVTLPAPEVQVASNVGDPVVSSAAPKRRGRPPLPAEEKARRAAERKAEKEKLAAERKAEKEANKAAQALQQVAEKVANGRKNSLDNESPVVAKSVLSTKATPSAPARTTQRSPPFTANWTTLTQTLEDTEASMGLDELRSSSPPPPMAAIDEADKTGTQMTRPQVNQSQHASPDLKLQRNLVTPVNKVRGAASATPLFLATDSQLGSSQPPARTLTNGELSPGHVSVGTQSQDEGSIRKPMRPVSNWAQKARFPRLSDIATQVVFSPLSAHPVPIPRPGVSANKDMSLLTSLGMDDSESDSGESDSGSAEDSESYIPKNRRAGVQRKKLIS